VLDGNTDNVIVGANGKAVGIAVGLNVGLSEGLTVGDRDGLKEGTRVGLVVVVGANEKLGAGTGVGALLASVGVEVGCDVEGREVG
jgi:hypothetical protein